MADNNINPILSVCATTGERVKELPIKDGQLIFVQDIPQKADVIFVPGSQEMALGEKAAALWKDGFAPRILVSGKYSITGAGFTALPEALKQAPQHRLDIVWFLRLKRTVCTLSVSCWAQAKMKRPAIS